MALKSHCLPGVITVAVVCLFDVCGGSNLVVHAKQGSSALLRCNVDPPPEGLSATHYVLEWIRHGDDIPALVKFGTHAPRIHPNYEGRVSLFEGTALWIMSLTLDDGGWYECRILLLDKPSDEARNGSWTLLSVTASPVFSEIPPMVTEAISGTSVTLKCIAHGNPPPTIKWYKDGVLMNQTGSVKGLNGSLSFTSVNRDTAGYYQCQASNSEGSETCSTQLRIKGPPVIRIPPTNTILNMSQNALLQCQAEADPPNMTYVWLREEENVYHRESLKTRVKVMIDGTLLISHLKPDDSGNYTCMPTNGLPTPPTASATLTVQYPARVTQMPEWTFLPAGMRGVISCPLAAEPPLLRVTWTKDGKELDLGMYPGWILTADGTIVIATTNDDAAGVYTCTPYNIYGTMGQSEPTTVILQDPPSLRVAPHSEYRQEVGQTLLIPCQAYGDPPPTVTWVKSGASSSSLYSVTNGSLLLQSLGKEHHGEWECHVTNRVATITASTSISVLGTSPHAVSWVSVEAEINQANISWESGFDGGYTQTFTVWLKCVCADREHQEWKSILTSSSSPSYLVTGLLPSTEYQFSVMAHNKLGSGPFSEMVTARTLDALPVGSRLEPPTLLSFNQSSEGVHLCWEAPSPQQLPIDGFLIQSRLEEGEWLNLDEDISPNKTDILIKGLQKSSNYELRLLSRSGEKLSSPSRSVNISILGIDEYLTSSHLLEFAPQQMLGGIIGGMGLVFLIALATMCVISQRRRRSLLQQKYIEDLPSDVYKCSSMKVGTTPDSPDSILKHNLLPPRSLSSSSSSSGHSSCGKSSCSDYRGQKQQLLPCTLPCQRSLTESHLHQGPQGSPVCPVELIHRGPDGRFMVKPYEEIKATASPSRTNPRQGPLMSEDVDNSMVSKSHSWWSHGEGRKHPPFVLSVDVPTYGTDICPLGIGQAMAEQLSLQRFPSLFKEQELSNMPPDMSSLISESSSTLFLPSGSTRSAASTLVLQMEHEREQGNLSHCLRLAREREELERELRRYTLDQDHHASHHKSAGSLRVERKRNVENDEEIGTAMEALQGKQLSSRWYYVSNNPSISGIRGSSCIARETSPTIDAQSLVPAQVVQGRSAEWSQGSRCSQMSNHCRSQSLERGEHQRSHLKDQRRRRTMTEGVPVCFDKESFYSILEKAHSTVKDSQKNARTYTLNQHCIVPRSDSMHKQQDWTAERSQAGCVGDYVEMCVDEPEVQKPFTISMLEHRSQFVPNLETITHFPSEIQLQDSHQHSEPCSPPILPLRATNWPSPHCQSPAAQGSQMHEKEEDEEDGPEVDVELQGFRSVPKLEGSCRSYASQSSGRGSLDQRSSRQSLSLSPPLTCFSNAPQESDRDEAGLQELIGKESPRRGSVDENYEWDSHYVTTHASDLKTPVNRGGPGGEVLSEETGRSGAEDSRVALNQEKKGEIWYF